MKFRRKIPLIFRSTPSINAYPYLNEQLRSPSLWAFFNTIYPLSYPLFPDCRGIPTMYGVRKAFKSGRVPTEIILSCFVSMSLLKVLYIFTPLYHFMKVIKDSCIANGKMVSIFFMFYFVTRIV